MVRPCLHSRSSLLSSVTGRHICRGCCGLVPGWSGATIVYWNCEAKASSSSYTMRTARFKVEAAPGTLSWSIGATGLPDLGDSSSGTHRAIWESYGRKVSPTSLYIAQRGSPLAPPSPPPAGPTPPPPPPPPKCAIISHSNHQCPLTSVASL